MYLFAALCACTYIIICGMQYIFSLITGLLCAHLPVYAVVICFCLIQVLAALGWFPPRQVQSRDRMLQNAGSFLNILFYCEGKLEENDDVCMYY